MNLRTSLSFACGVLLAALCFASAADQVYRWVDKDGHVHYSETPPAGTGVQAQSVNMSPPPPDPVTVQNQQNLAQQLKDKDKQTQDDAQKQQQDAQKKDQQKKNCDDLRERLAVLTQSGRTATVDAQGQVTYLSDEAREKQAKALQDQIAKDCSAGQ